MENKKQISHVERIKSVIDMAKEYNMPVKKVFDIYNRVNDILYISYKENILYNPDIENITFAYIRRYLSRLN